MVRLPTPSRTSTVGVIICHHTGRLIDRCLDSVYTSKGVHPEVVVVTSDATFTTSYAAVTVVRETGGPAHKRNVGVTFTTSPYLVFLDDDVEISPYCLHELMQGLKDRSRAVMGFAKIYNMERREEFDDCGSWLTWTGFLFARASGSITDQGQYDEPIRCLASKSATAIIRRTAFFDAGGFDADYYILGEETDLAWRCWLRGGEVWYFPHAKSWHAFGTSLKPPAQYYTLSRIHRLGCRNYMNLLLTNVGTQRLIGMLPIHILIWLLSALGFFVTGQGARGRLIVGGLWDVVRGLQRTLWKRRRVQASRTRPDRELFPLISAHPPKDYYLQRLTSYWRRGLHG